MATSKMMAAKKRAAAQKAKKDAEEAGTTQVNDAISISSATATIAADGEEILKEALASKAADGLSAGELIVNEKARKQLLSKAGFDYIDVRELTPNPKNTYVVDEGSVESLASLIFESKNTTPLIVREVPVSASYPHGYEIVDGERRYRAHLLLGQKHGEHWYMAPVRVFHLGELSDEDAEFMLHAENVGQRDMKPSERARGVAMVIDRVVKQREADPESMRGRKTKDIIAEQFGVSARTAVMESNIGHNLSQAGMDAYDAGEITKTAADAVSKLPQKEQEELIAQVKSGELPKSEVEHVAKGKKPTSTRIPKTADEDLRDARRALKRALVKNSIPDRVLIAELRNLLDKLDPEHGKAEQ